MKSVNGMTVYEGDDPNELHKYSEKIAQEIHALLEKKVDKVTGKGLSTYDFTKDLKQKLEKLNNYDDTEIKEDITNIKKEQQDQNADIEELQKTQTNLKQEISELQKDIQANSIEEETKQAKYLYIGDATNARGKINVLGNVEQETIEGYNLLPNELESGTENGITYTVNKDLSITLNGTATDTVTLELLKTKAETLKAGNYIFSTHATGRLFWNGNICTTL